MTFPSFWAPAEQFTGGSGSASTAAKVRRDWVNALSEFYYYAQRERSVPTVVQHGTSTATGTQVIAAIAAGQTELTGSWLTWGQENPGNNGIMTRWKIDSASGGTDWQPGTPVGSIVLVAVEHEWDEGLEEVVETGRNWVVLRCTAADEEAGEWEYEEVGLLGDGGTPASVPPPAVGGLLSGTVFSAIADGAIIADGDPVTNSTGVFDPIDGTDDPVTPPVVFDRSVIGAQPVGDGIDAQAAWCDGGYYVLNPANALGDGEGVISGIIHALPAGSLTDATLACYCAGVQRDGDATFPDSAGFADIHLETSIAGPGAVALFIEYYNDGSTVQTKWRIQYNQGPVIVAQGTLAGDQMRGVWAMSWNAEGVWSAWRSTPGAATWELLGAGEIPLEDLDPADLISAMPLLRNDWLDTTPITPLVEWFTITSARPIVRPA